MTRPLATDAYLSTAKSADLLGELDGNLYVAGRYRDPVSSEYCCFVEYCDPAVLASAGRCAELVRRLAQDFTDVESIMLTVRTDDRLPRPWERLVTYVRFEQPGPPATDPRVRIERAAAQHFDAIAAWLAAAFESGYARRELPVDTAAVAATARDILSAPDLLAYVAVIDDVAVGHLTARAEAMDEVTDEEYIDVIDMLVEPVPLGGVARAALVGAAAVDAARTGKPLLGNVTHPSVAVSPTQDQEVLDALLARGWRVDHVDWRRSMP